MVNYFWLKIKGNNSKEILMSILKSKVNIINIKYKENQIFLKVSYNDYKKIKNMRIFNQISVIKISGKKKWVEDVKNYKISIITFITGVFFILFLSNLILFINIETDNIKLKNLIEKELKDNNIMSFSFKKDYFDLKKISSKIKNDHLDKIEWIEFNQKGVHLHVKVIERISYSKPNSSGYKDIVAKKNGYIRKIYSRQGQLLKNIDDYVKKGEIIISGNIFKNNKPVAKVKASGKVYAEVWYIVKLNSSFYHNKKIEKNKGQIKLILKLNNKNIVFFSFPKKIYTEKKVNLFENNLFKLYIKKEKDYYIKKEKYTSKELEKQLKKAAEKHIINNLKKDEYKLNQKTLKKYNKNGKMYMEVFFKTYEDIAKEQNIKKIKEKKEEE